MLKKHSRVSVWYCICFCISHFKSQLSLTTRCQGNHSLAMSGWTVQNHYTLFFPPPDSLSRTSPPFSSITRCQSSSREAFATELLTCHSGHWRPINENSAGDFPPFKRLWREAGAITLPPWVFFNEKDSYCHNIPASSCSAPQRDKRLFDLPVSDCSRYFNADILAVSDSKCRKSFHALINVDF